MLMIKPIIGNELEEKIELLDFKKTVGGTWWVVDRLVFATRKLL
jgi:hypothetical protein